MYIFSSNFNLKFNFLNLLIRVIDHDNGVQTSYRLTKFGSTQCRISYCINMSLVAKCRAEKKKDEINTKGTIQNLQVTNLYLSMCWQDEYIKLWSPISPRNLIDIPYKNIRLAIQNYTSPKKRERERERERERVVTAERAKFLSVIQSIGESNDDLLARSGEEARHCGFKKKQNSVQP